MEKGEEERGRGEGGGDEGRREIWEGRERGVRWRGCEVAREDGRKGGREEGRKGRKKWTLRDSGILTDFVF